MPADLVLLEVTADATAFNDAVEHVFEECDRALAACLLPPELLDAKPSSANLAHLHSGALDRACDRYLKGIR